MSLAYLVLAHNTPSHFQRLVRALDSSRCHFFVHVDRKSNLAPFRAGVSGNTVTFLEDRVSVFWGEYSQVEAILHLMRTALRQMPTVQRLCLVSASDYPLRSAEYIEAFFAARATTEFINLVRMPCEAVGKTLDRLCPYRLQNHWNNRLAVGVVARLNQLMDSWAYQDNTIPLSGTSPPVVAAPGGR